MATYKILIGGQEIKAEKSKNLLRELLAKIGMTSNVSAKTVQSAVSQLKNVSAIADALIAEFDGDMVLEIHEKPDTKNAEYTLQAKYTVEKFAKRLTVAAMVPEFTGEIFTTKKESTDSDGEQQELDW